jgi:transposase
MGQVTVFSGPERRRRWSDEERRLILAEAFSPEACVAQVARCFDRIGLHVAAQAR